jgi:hypothetical protein
MGAAARWSDPANRRVVKIGDLSTDERRLVLAMIDAARSSKPKPDSEQDAA